MENRLVGQQKKSGIVLTHAHYADGELTITDKTDNFQEVAVFIQNYPVKKIKISDSLDINAEDLKMIFNYFNDNNEVRALDVSNNPIKGKGLVLICSKFRNLTSLKVANCKIKHEKLMYLDRLSSSLTELNISENVINFKGVKRICKYLPHLTHLDLSQTTIDDASLQYLSIHLTKLMHLRVDSNNLTDAALKNLPQLTKLQYLSLNNNKIRTAGTQILSEMSNLLFLYITSNNIKHSTYLHKMRPYIIDTEGNPFKNHKINRNLSPMAHIKAAQSLGHPVEIPSLMHLTLFAMLASPTCRRALRVVSKQLKEIEDKSNEVKTTYFNESDFDKKRRKKK